MRSRVPFFLFVALIAFFLPIDSAEALVVSPLRQSVVIDPGKSDTVRITVKNDATTTVAIAGDIDAFRIHEETGRAIFDAMDEAESWIDKRDLRMTLLPGEEHDLAFLIRVPEDALPGGHYLALFASVESAGGNLGSRVGSLLFLYVGGAVQESISRQAFAGEKFWYHAKPIRFFLELQNNGSIHVIPTGVVTIANSRGRIIAKLPVNDTGRKLLPLERWKESYVLDALSWRDIGQIRATAFIQYGLGQKQIMDSITVWFVPIPIIVLAAIIVVCIFFFIRRMRKTIDRE